MADQVNKDDMKTKLRSRSDRQYNSVSSLIGPGTRSRHGYKAKSPDRYSNISNISNSHDTHDKSYRSSGRGRGNRGSSSSSRVVNNRSRSMSSSSNNDKQNPFTALRVMDDESDGEEDKPCVKCGGIINEGIKALQCEFCANWACLHCTEVPESMYDLFMEKEVSSFLWSCESCIHAIPTIKNLGRAMQGIRDEQSQTKVELNRLNSKVDNLESSIEEKVQEAIEAYRDRESRKCNIIVHNIPESNKSEAKERREEDTMEVRRLFEDSLGLEEFEIQSTVRLGKKIEEKHRLLKITVGSVKTKRDILSNSKKLRNADEWSRVFITPDLTPKEREKSRRLREELKRRKDAGEEGLVIRKGEIVKVNQEDVPSPSLASQGAVGGDGLFR